MPDSNPTDDSHQTLEATPANKLSSPPGQKRISRSTGIWVSVLGLLGIALCVGPPGLIATTEEMPTHRPAGLMQFHAVSFWLGWLLVVFAVTLLFDSLVDLRAGLEGKAKAFGMELPIRIKGPFVFFVVLAAGSYVVIERGDLTSKFDVYTRLELAQNELESVTRERDLLKTILSNERISEDLEPLHLTIACGTGEDSIWSLWARYDGSSSSFQWDEIIDSSVDKPLRVGTRRQTYALGTQNQNELLKLTVQMADNGVIDGSIELQGDIALADVCKHLFWDRNSGFGGSSSEHLPPTVPEQQSAAGQGQLSGATNKEDL